MFYVCMKLILPTHYFFPSMEIVASYNTSNFYDTFTKTGLISQRKAYTIVH